MTLEKLKKEHRVPGERLVLITDVTRMSGNQVCVAGIDVENKVMVRPLTPDGLNWDEGEWVKEGFYEVGNLVSFRSAPAGNAAYPHANEDYRVSFVTPVEKASLIDLYSACVETSDNSADSIFNGQLVDNKYVIANSICRSLGCILVNRDDLRVSDYYGKVQISYRDACGRWYNFPVTELWTKKHGDSAVAAPALENRLNGCNGAVVLRIGLARAWDGGSQAFDPKRCYVQVNGLILPA